MKASSAAKASSSVICSGGSTRRRPDISTARAVLGWEPTTSLVTGLRKTFAWFAAEHGAGHAAPLAAERRERLSEAPFMFAKERAEAAR
ncbi:hypothetical protein [Erythrobacter sp. WG]|uniref:hypothetical protein n=1 Tax=Erythrobacter sp. WG TaxID=2985510 RepID=UPI002271AD83|nr:hypothetical protein [Erythrobacter sp. WG]MCX9146070.1 hypothetical protein [Erythrobacter sp. WG]